MKSRFSSGWVIVATTFVLLIGSTSTTLCFGLFVKPLTQEFGWSRAGVSGAMSLLMAVSGLVGVLVGRLSDRYGPRPVVAAGTVIGALSYVLLAKMSSLWQFYALFGVGVGIYSGCGYTPAVATISKWFDARRRTLAIGVALLGITIGQMVMSPIIAQVIETDDWRTAWVVLAIVAFVCGLPAVALLGTAPEATDRDAIADGVGEQKPRPAAVAGLSVREASRTAPFWMLMITGFVLAVAFYGFNAHIVPYATDVGASATAAALIMTVSSMGGIPGTLLASPIGLRFGHRYALLMLVAASAGVMFLFIFAGSIWSFYVLAVILGFAFSAAVPVRMAIAPPLFGLRAIGAIIGLMSLAFSLGGILGPFLAGYVFDSTGSYDVAFLIFGILLAAGALAVHFLRARRTSGAAAEGPIWRAGDGLE